MCSPAQWVFFRHIQYPEGKSLMKYVLVFSIAAAALLSGCVVAPYDGYGRGGYYGGRDRGDHDGDHEGRGRRDRGGDQGDRRDRGRGDRD
ncbi:hypothetical protein CS8_023960 [Cupriavidus sp. 8B]